MQKCNVRAFPSRESKFLIFTISKHYFLAFNTSLYNTSYIKDSIFFTASFKFFFYSLYVSFSLLSLSAYLCLSLSLKTNHFLCKLTPTISCCRPPPSKKKKKNQPPMPPQLQQLPLSPPPTTMTTNHQNHNQITNPNPQPNYHSPPTTRKRKRKTIHQNHKPKPTTSSPPPIGKGKRKTTTKREQKHINAITYGLIHTCE